MVDMGTLQRLKDVAKEIKRRGRNPPRFAEGDEDADSDRAYERRALINDGSDFP